MCSKRGCVRCLQKRMEVNQVRRFAGASAGSMVAALLAVGYDSHQIQHFLSDRVDKVFLGNALLPVVAVVFVFNTQGS